MRSVWVSLAALVLVAVQGGARDPLRAPAGNPAAAAADSARPFTPAATLAELESRIRHLLDSTRTPGAGLAIVRNDSVIYAGGIGLARVEPAQPATAATLFRIGSTSKAFVALVALQLQREGTLALDDPLKTHLPDFWYKNAWEDTDPLRLVHFLEHTSGFDDNSFRTYAHSDPTPLTLEEGLALDTTRRVSRWRPGTRFAYCNTGPAIVARVIEKIEGKPFEQVVQERFFDPLGMRTATYLYPDTTRVPMAALYRSDGKTPYPYWHVFIRPAGSINASANDMAQYVRFLLGRGTIGGDTLLPREDIERMEHPATWIGTRAGLSIGYGLHMYSIPDTTGWVWKGHNGGMEGGLSDMRYLPEAGVGYAAQINASNGAVLGEIGRQVRAFLTHSLPRPAEPPVGAVSPTIAAEFGGWYRPVSPRQQHAHFLERILDMVHVSFAGDSMRVDPLLDDAATFVPVDSLRFRRHGQSLATAALLRDSANKRPQGIEGVGRSLSGQSLARVTGAVALVEIGSVILLVAAVITTALVVVISVVRGLIRMARKHPVAPSPARPLWRLAIVVTLLLVAPFLVFVTAGAEIQQLGNLSLTSATVFVGGILFAVSALVGAAMALRRRDVRGRGTAISIWSARVILVLYFVVACYLTYWGFIGWRMWA